MRAPITRGPSESQPTDNVGQPEPRTTAMLAAAASELELAGKAWRPPASKSIDLPTRQPGQGGKLADRDELRVSLIPSFGTRLERRSVRPKRHAPPWGNAGHLRQDLSGA